jgi:hypothetical protein
MEPVLTNRCRWDETSLKKGFAWTSRKSTVQLLLLPVVFLVIAVYHLCAKGLDLIPIILLAAGIAYPIVALRLPARFTKLQLRRMEENFQTDHLDTVTAFRDEELETWQEGKTSFSRIRYDSIETAAALSGLILLWTRSKQFVLLDPAGFEHGTEADFWRLMNEKCPRAVPKKHRV